MAGEVKNGPVRLGEIAEDATGFGGVEWHTARDLLLRPRAVLDAYETGGPTGGGRYARPVRFYLALCGVLMFYLFLIGGTKQLVERMPADMLARAIAVSGKSREVFFNDADGWVSLAVVPVLAMFYALAVAPVIKRWGRTNWRIAFRATFALLCAWTVPMLPFGPWPYMERVALVGAVLTAALLMVAFWRMGRGRWWTRPWEGAGKAVAVYLLMQVGAVVGMFPVFAIGALGGIYGSQSEVKAAIHRSSGGREKGSEICRSAATLTGDRHAAMAQPPSKHPPLQQRRLGQEAFALLRSGKDQAHPGIVDRGRTTIGGAQCRNCRVQPIIRGARVAFRTCCIRRRQQRQRTGDRRAAPFRYGRCTGRSRGGLRQKPDEQQHYLSPCGG